MCACERACVRACVCVCVCVRGCVGVGVGGCGCVPQEETFFPFFLSVSRTLRNELNQPQPL